MKNLRRLSISFALLCVLTLTAFAGETNSPPSAPGETNSPPSATASVTSDDSDAPGETTTATSANTGSEYSVVELAVDLMQSALLLF